MIDRRMACLCVIVTMALPLSGCKIVPIAEEEAAAASAQFDAVAYADGLWSKRALPLFSSAAKPAAEVIPAIGADLAAAGVQYGTRAGEGSPWSFIISGSGTVTAKNTQSRAGTVVLTIDGMAPQSEAVLQIGPVIRGNAIRDALPFVAFKDFTNQIEYANAGKALTALAAAGVASDVEALTVGERVEFTGAISMASASDRLLVTPVTLKKIQP